MPALRPNEPYGLDDVPVLWSQPHGWDTAARQGAAQLKRPGALRIIDFARTKRTRSSVIVICRTGIARERPRRLYARNARMANP